ncbi:MAG: hypothetical protein J2P57_14220, partial [Acidimicrobiaceae bacterium]|nr:hypothetical protein [Acidimicrobiaceae bacterium]
AWHGHLGRAQHDHQVALAQRDAAWQAERFAFDRLQAARAQAEGAGSGRYRAAALAELRDAEFGYEIAVSQRQQAAMWEVEQHARVARCGRALALAQQAAELLEAGASDLGAASQAVAHGQARLSAAQGATNTARAHLTNMEQHAEEAVIHANRAEGHLISATQHLKASEDWLGQGYVLANDAAGDMSQQIKQLQLADRPMGGGGGGGGGPGSKGGPVEAERSGESVGDVFAELDRFRASSRAAVVARLILGDKSFVGTNLARGHQPIKGTFSFFVQHAEGDVFSQLINAGDYAGKSATLYVTDKPCGFCTSSISAAARSMGLTSVTIMTPQGVFGTYKPEAGLVREKI